MTTLVSYNVRYFSHATHGLIPTDGARDRIAAALGALRPDIVCLQEVRTAASLHAFAEALRASSGRAYRAFHAEAHRGRWYSTGLALLVDEAKLAVGSVVPHALTTEDDRGERRVCAHAVVQRGGANLHVFNVHLSLPSPVLRSGLGHGANQLCQARRLSDLVRSKTAGEPYVLCGDFNSTPGSPVERHFGAPGDPPTSPTARVGPWRNRLDYAFTGNGARVATETVHTFGPPRGAFQGLSDHLPIMISLAP